jgi:hypothetical protein
MTLNNYFETNNIAFVQNITLRAAITCKALEDHALTYLKSTLYERGCRVSKLLFIHSTCQWFNFNGIYFL